MQVPFTNWKGEIVYYAEAKVFGQWGYHKLRDNSGYCVIHIPTLLGFRTYRKMKTARLVVGALAILDVPQTDAKDIPLEVAREIRSISQSIAAQCGEY